MSRWPLTGAFRWESSWSEAGGGLSAIVPRPAYQNNISFIVGAQRGVPDISADANPDTGVWVTCGVGCGSTPGDWFVFGGTSVSSPLLAAMTNGAGRFAPNTASELTTIYANSGRVRFGAAARFNKYYTWNLRPLRRFYSQPSVRVGEPPVGLLYRSRISERPLRALTGRRRSIA